MIGERNSNAQRCREGISTQGDFSETDQQSTLCVYKVKGHYKQLLSKTSSNYFQNLNKDIEDGKVLNWQAFKKLKSQKNSKINYDSHDMDKFENFAFINTEKLMFVTR